MASVSARSMVTLAQSSSAPWQLGAAASLSSAASPRPRRRPTTHRRARQSRSAAAARVTQGDARRRHSSWPGCPRRAARPSRGLRRADGLIVRSGEPAHVRAARLVRGGLRTGARGTPGAARSHRTCQSRSITVTSSPAATPVAVGEQREPVGGGARRERVALLRPHAASPRSGRRTDVDDARGRGGACRRPGGAIACRGASRPPRGRNGWSWPIICSSAGRANSSKLTSDDTGLPGSPNTGVPRTIAKHNGFAGLIATWYQSTRERARRVVGRDALERVAHVVVVADRHAAARDHRVARRERVARASAS